MSGQGAGAGTGESAMAAAFAAATGGRAGETKSIIRTAVKEPVEFSGNNKINRLVNVSVLLRDAVRTPEQLEEERIVAIQNAEWVANAAEGLVKIRSQIKFFDEVVVSGGVLNAGQKAQLEKLRMAEKQILHSGDVDIQRHREFAEFLAEIRAAGPEIKKAEEFIVKAIADGRYHKASNAEAKMIIDLMKNKRPFPQGLIFLNNMCYLPSVEGVEKSKGQKAFEAELTRYVRQSIKVHRDSEEAGVSDDLRGLQAKKIGKYRILFEDGTGKNGKRYSAGTGIVEIVIRKVENGPVDQVLAIMPRQGFGSLKIFSVLAEKGFWVAVSWYDADLSAKNIPDTLREDAKKFIRTLKAGIAAFYHRESGGGDK